MLVHLILSAAALQEMNEDPDVAVCEVKNLALEIIKQGTKRIDWVYGGSGPNGRNLSQTFFRGFRIGATFELELAEGPKLVVRKFYK